MAANPSHWTDQKVSGRYLVREKLGSGGMGSVYLARDLKLDADVVIKAPHPMMIKDAAFAARFQQEIRSLVQLSHPHVVKVMDVDEHEGLPFAVLQYLPGGSLEDRLADEAGQPRRMDPVEVLGWIEDVAEALDYIHARGYVHRDIKPANLLFDEHGRVYLGDFGIAKAVAATGNAGDTGLTGTGMAIGTAEYMAPEMLLKESEGQPYDGRVDQYALGVTVYECLCGHRPYSGPNVAIVAVAMATTRAPMPHHVRTEIPEIVSKSVAKSLLKDPEKRYPNCQTFARTLAKAVRSTASQEQLATVRRGVTTSVRGPRTLQAERSRGSGAGGPRVAPPPLPPRPTPAAQPFASGAELAPLPPLIDTGRTRGHTVGSRRPDTVHIQLTKRQIRIFGAIAAGVVGLAVLLILFNSGGSEPTEISAVDPDVPRVQPVGAAAAPADGADSAPGEPPTAVAPEESPARDSGGSTPVTPANVEADPGTLVNYRDGETRTLRFRVTGSTAGSVWGSDVYTDDSHLATASVHAGVLKEGETGVVQVTLLPGRQSYSGTTRNAVTTADWGSNSASYRVEASQATAAQSTDLTNSIGMKLVRIPSGEFTMGSPASDRLAQDQEKPPHTARIPKPFYLGVYEVTQAEYRTVMGTNPSHFGPNGGGRGKLTGISANRGGGQSTGVRRAAEQSVASFLTSDFPVETVSWSDAAEFCRRLSNRAEERAAGRTYRLPTETEWEYACRAGTTTVRYFDTSGGALEDYARFRSNADGRTGPVGTKQPNAWGLYDMYGNVWEWCSDYYDRNYYEVSPVYNPHGPTTGTSRVLRGGSWWDDSPFCRSANRDFYLPTYRDYEVGFRVVCDAAIQ